MKSITISNNDAGQRVDRLILKTFDRLPKSLMFKEIRKKNIKVNKKRCTPEQILCEGDILELYLKDEVLHIKEKHYDFLKASTDLDIIYEDENIILLNKKVGILCHPDGKDYIDNLVARLKRYLFEKGEWNPDNSSFTPSLANRIDRNTGGIVIGAKNSQALKIINDKIKSREIEKYYLTVVHGKMPKKSEVLTAYLTKNEKKNMVAVTNNQTAGSKQIITQYTVLDYKEDASLLEVKLLTGRTHQIRAHLAHIGHPLYGDGKYGIDKGRYRQALYSYKLQFSFKDENALSYLNGKIFEAENIQLLQDYKERKFNEG
ncbi:MAG: RluA family pseudouridine synthase [Eubacterium sp.]|nr:RluA family pseudouridine synthase [Eubacterium sp.]